LLLNLPMVMEEKTFFFLNKTLKKRKILNYINQHDQVMVQKFLQKSTARFIPVRSL